LMLSAVEISLPALADGLIVTNRSDEEMLKKWTRIVSS